VQDITEIVRSRQDLVARRDELQRWWTYRPRSCARR
jgi:hypothetical protein